MSDAAAVHRIALALETLARDLDALQAAGQGIPAVEKNAVRMRGALRQLEVQFADLDALDS
ncbi:MAG: hypothetical protein ACYDA8_04705 [Deferrisomatales bacterium]